jgi:putative redox protein
MPSEPRIVVEYENGRRFRATCDGYTVTTGKGDDGDAGRDGMSPSQLFVASLGACIALYVSGYCKHHDIPCDALTVEVEHETERAPSRTTAVSARIHLGVEVSEKDAAAILQVARKCHVHHTIEHGMHIDIGFGNPAPAVEHLDA